VVRSSVSPITPAKCADPRTGHFRILLNNRLIGWSSFEDADEAMGIRQGRFHPEEAYPCHAGVFQRIAALRDEARLAAAEERERLLRMEAVLLRELPASTLRVETDDGRSVPTAWVDIEDWSPELGESGLTVTLCVDTWETYEVVFGSDAPEESGP
jgi:hypothetical protein